MNLDFVMVFLQGLIDASGVIIDLQYCMKRVGDEREREGVRARVRVPNAITFYHV
jgi:hypothetical protein